MTVTITWELWDGANWNNVTELDHGNGAVDSALSTQRLRISHDGINQITNCKFYLTDYTGTYTGGASAADDLAEILFWGEEADPTHFYGLALEMNALASFPWTSPEIFQSGASAQGTEADDAILLSVNSSSSMSIDGVIPASASSWPVVEIRITIPPSETTIGVRQFSSKFYFTYTS